MQLKCVILALVPSLGLAAPTVNLGYSTYQGIGLPTVNEFLGMRYAAPPTGDARWRAPAAPTNTSGVQDALQFGDVCLTVGAGFPASGQSEDCLFINVFTPTNATGSSNLPVWVFIQGGGFADDASPTINGTDAVMESGNNMIMVTFNYRVGLFGFLASSEVQQNGNVNAGILDMIAALQWVQQHISQFGGDPTHVVIHGESAGAGAVAILLTAFGGENQNLFVGAVMEAVPQLTQLTVSEAEFQYTALIHNSGCSSSADTLACIRALDSAGVQAWNQGIAYPGRPGQPLFPWLPVVDGSLLQTRVYEAFQQGNFVKVPTIIGDVTNEGTMFAPNASSAADIETFFQNNYPSLSADNATAIVNEYPEDIAPPLAEHAPFFPAASLAYGEALLNCPGLNFARYLNGAEQPTWNYRFNVLTPTNEAAGLGVPHGFDLNAIFGGGYEDADQTNTMRLMGYYISFVRDLEPNTFAFTGSPSWPQYNGAAGGSRLLINNNNTTTEAVPSDQIARCAFWEGMIGPMEV